MRDYTFPIKKITNKFRSIKSLDQLKEFIQQRAAHVTQSTLYGYVKTRIGSRYAMMFEDSAFSNSINIAKWNIYVTSLSDCTCYVFSYLTDNKNLKKNDAKEIYLSILDNEKLNGLSDDIYIKAKSDFEKKLNQINWNNFHKEEPFNSSAKALYNWSPIADELKVLDKEIVLNSMKLKWNIVENEFKELTKNLNFD